MTVLEDNEKQVVYAIQAFKKVEIGKEWNEVIKAKVVQYKNVSVELRDILLDIIQLSQKCIDGKQLIVKARGVNAVGQSMIIWKIMQQTNIVAGESINIQMAEFENREKKKVNDWESTMILLNKLSIETYSKTLESRRVNNSLHFLSREEQ